MAERASSRGIYLAEIPRPSPGNPGEEIIEIVRTIGEAAQEKGSVLINGMSSQRVANLRRGIISQDYEQTNDLAAFADWGVLDLSHEATSGLMRAARMGFLRRKPVLFLGHVSRDPRKHLQDIQSMISEFPQPSRLVLWDGAEGIKRATRSFIDDFGKTRLKKTQSPDTEQSLEELGIIVNGSLVMAEGKLWFNGERKFPNPAHFWLLRALALNRGRLSDPAYLDQSGWRMNGGDSLPRAIKSVRTYLGGLGRTYIVECRDGSTSYIMPVIEPPSTESQKLVAGLIEQRRVEKASDKKFQPVNTFRSKSVEVDLEARTATVNGRILRIISEDQLNLLALYIKNSPEITTWANIAERFERTDSNTTFRKRIGVVNTGLRRNLRKAGSSVSIEPYRNIGFVLSEPDESAVRYCQISNRLKIGLNGEGLVIDGKPVSLGLTSDSLMSFLAKRLDQLVAQEEIINSIWPDQNYSTNAFNTRINRIRQSLGSYRDHLYGDRNGNIGLFTAPRKRN